MSVLRFCDGLPELLRDILPGLLESLVDDGELRSIRGSEDGRLETLDVF